MIKLSLNKATKEAGVAKSTLLDALKSGRMSAKKNDKGYWEIDPAELFRVFPKQSKTGSDRHSETTVETHENTLKTAQLQVELEAAQKETTMLRETLADLRTDRDAWRQQAERQTLLLQDRHDKEAGSDRTGWLNRLFGRNKRSGL